MIARALVAAMAAATISASPAAAAIPTDGGMAGGTSVTVAVCDCFVPRVSGDIVAYTRQSGGAPAQAPFYRFSTGVERLIGGGEEAVPFVDGERISFIRGLAAENNRIATMVLDVATGELTDVDPQPGSARSVTALAGDTLVYLDHTPTQIDVVAYDLRTGTRHRFESPEIDQWPDVSPAGDVIAWDGCPPEDFTACTVHQARRTASGWEHTELTELGPFGRAATDGTYVVYDDFEHHGSTPATDTSIYFRRVAGGPATRLELPGNQSYARIDDGVISFLSGPGDYETWDVYAYVIATNTLLRVTDTPAVGEFTNDIDVAPGGRARIVWDARGAEHGIYARTFTLPGTDATPPVVTPRITGTLGNDNWYTSDVTLRWDVSDPESAVTSSGCADRTITADQAATDYACTATSAGGATGPVTATIKRDATPPSVILGAHPASYRADQTVTISCTATDARSGIAQGCTPISAGACTFGAGPETLTRTVRDRAGNTTTASTSFTVVVNAASTGALTQQFVQSSANYQRLGPVARRVVDALVTSATAFLTRFGPNALPAFKAQFIDAYQAAVPVTRQLRLADPGPGGHPRRLGGRALIAET